jgi:hypothetical protein
MKCIGTVKIATDKFKQSFKNMSLECDTGVMATVCVGTTVKKNLL